MYHHLTAVYKCTHRVNLRYIYKKSINVHMSFSFATSGRILRKLSESVVNRYWAGVLVCKCR